MKNEILEDRLADHEELKDGGEKHLARDSPLFKMDTAEDKIIKVRMETEALKQSK